MDASNRKDIRRAEKAAAVAERNRGATVRGIMSTTPGREYFYNLLSSCHIFATPFAENPYAMYAIIGEQNAGKRILADIMMYAPDEYLTMLREANGRRTLHDTIDANRTVGEQPSGEESGWEPSQSGDEPELDFNWPNTRVAGSPSSDLEH